MSDGDCVRLRPIYGELDVAVMVTPQPRVACLAEVALAAGEGLLERAAGGWIWIAYFRSYSSKQSASVAFSASSNKIDQMLLAIRPRSDNRGT